MGDGAGVRHALLPLVTTIVLVFVGYQALLFALAHELACYAPLIVVAWLSVGVLLLVVLRVLGREDWLLRAGEVAYGQGDLAEREKAG